MSILALFATFTLFACASAAKHCCVPERYSGQTIVKTYREGHFFQGTGEVYYDYSAGMHAAFINITIDEFKGIFSLVSTHYDVNSGMVYTMTGGVCSKEKLDESWLKETDEPHCIPDDAVLAATFALGGPREDVEVSRYIQSVNKGQRQVVVTKHHCFPVQEIFFTGEKTKYGHEVKDSTMTTVANLKLTVTDPSVFVLPEICEKTILSTKRNNDKSLPVDPWKFVPFLASL